MGGENFIHVEFTKLNPLPRWRKGVDPDSDHDDHYKPFPPEKITSSPDYYFNKAKVLENMKFDAGEEYEHAITITRGGDLHLTVTAGKNPQVRNAKVKVEYARSVVYLDALPKTGSGKIDRQALREDRA